MRRHVRAVSAAVLLVLSGCGAPGPGEPIPAPAPAPTLSTASPVTSSITPPASTSVTTSAPTSAPTSAAVPAPPERVVVLDPGHNGGNAANPARVNRPVPAGRGRSKPCNTTGTATDAGFPEHEFSWAVAVLVRDALTGHGVRVLLTRPSDDGVGPCVDERAAVGNRAEADAVVSIHADGSTDRSAHGFHVAYSAPPLNAAQGAPALRLATAMRDALAASFPLSTYIGDDGLSARDDLAGLNLSERPAVLVECGNMRNAAEAAAFADPAGRQSYADAVTAGILAYLAGL